MTRRAPARPAATPRHPLLAATLIVRDEAANLPGCLDSLRGIVDEVVVYDTGSVDGTRELATAAGARVLAGYWDHDFARARNAALAMTRAQWVLIVDADERVDGDPLALRQYLRGPGGGLDLLLAQVTNIADGRSGDTLTSTRVARRAAVRWDGAVHEQLVPVGGAQRRASLAPHVLRVLHHGYADPATAHAKALRNLALAQAEVDRLVGRGGHHDPYTVARVLLDLGRSAVGAGQRQEAVDAFETLRELVPDGVHRAQATGLLAQVLLDEGGFDEVALVLEAELRGSGQAPEGYCDWLRAQALARLGDVPGALQLLAGIESLVDPVGTRMPLAVVLVARTVLATAAGRLDEAGDTLLQALLEHGAGAEHLGLLAQLWAGREGELEHRLATGRGPNVAQVRTALAAALSPVP